MRREKDHFFHEDPDSPIPWEFREKYRGLPYFPRNPKYRVTVKLHRYPKPEPVVLATSKGVPRNMLKVGYFEFTIDGQTRRLQAYKSIPKAGESNDDSLFVPFRDATGGKESSPAGRCLDRPRTTNAGDGLTFNLGANPYA